ncbi:helix-turn-helix domain-containing protein [Ureibacillus sp. MALMAid1270]|uniref:helix-turn-helix domain-containing protein n=1 Tax=Ureibacillus sp. MALMAid1270 TaxID=3411629 RepID=UPI003BA4B177
MKNEVSKFGKHLKEYREELNINQNEAAYMLGIIPNTYSNYERCERPIPMAYLPIIKEVFQIPDDRFLDMLLDRPRRKTRESAEEAAIRLKDMREKYITGVTDSLYDLINDSSELRQLLGFISTMDSKKRRLYLNGLRQILVVYDDLLNAQLSDRTPDDEDSIE